MKYVNAGNRPYGRFDALADPVFSGINEFTSLKISHSNTLSLSDGELWELFRSGSETAFEAIYSSNFDKLFNYGMQFVKDEALVEDVIHDLFMDLRRRRSHLSATDRILPYLYSAFRHKMLRTRNKLKRFETMEEHSFPLALELSIEEQLIDAEADAEQKKALKKALDQLSEKHREIIFLYFYENLSYEEIREIQGFDNIKSARNLLYKALQSLRGVFKYIALFFMFEVL
jgi:RNA polymerase sigma factor (sigma-70 family)